jgi:DNA-binding CsgD family transcriptional regulator/PAS domain-containing protein
MYSEGTLLRLVERVYDAALAPDRWPEFLNALSDVIDGHVLNLAFTDTGRAETTLVFATRFDPDAERRYHKHFSALDPWVKIGLERRLFRTGVVELGTSLMSPSDYRRTAFYNDFGRFCDLMGGISAVIRAERSVSAMLNASQRSGGREFDEGDVQLLRQLLPHLQRAFQLHERFTGLAQARTAAEDVIDKLPFGVVMLGGAGRVVLVNRAAEQILSSRDGLTLRNKTLEAASGQQTTQLRALIAGAIAASRGERLSSGGPLAVSRPSLRRPLQVLVTPLRAVGAPFSLGTAAPCAAVFISDPELEPLTNDAILRQFFGLTPAETRLAILLLQHKSVEESAESLHISLNTARTHLKKLFEKTGTRRQSELVSLLGTGVGQLRP